MIEKLASSTENIMGFRIQGKLTEADYLNVLAPDIEQGIAHHGKIRVLFQMEKFEGWTVGGAWEDLILGPKFVSVEKLAVVVDETWDEWMTWLFRIFTALTRTETQFFRVERLTEAWEWIRK
jgi:hypothetical protein